MTEILIWTRAVSCGLVAVGCLLCAGLVLAIPRWAGASRSAVAFPGLVERAALLGLAGAVQCGLHAGYVLAGGVALYAATNIASVALVVLLAGWLRAVWRERGALTAMLARLAEAERGALR